MVSPSSHSATPMLHVTLDDFLSDAGGHLAQLSPNGLSNVAGVVKRALHDNAKLLTSQAADNSVLPSQLLGDIAQNDVASIVTKIVIDLFEVINVADDRGQRSGRRACTGIFCLFEEGAAVQQSRQVVRVRQPNEFLLHRQHPLGRSQSRPKLFRNRRLADVVVSAALQRTDQVLVVVARRHENDVERSTGRRRASEPANTNQCRRFWATRRS